MFLSICLIFCQFQSGVAYKTVAYKIKSAHIISHLSKIYGNASVFKFFSRILKNARGITTMMKQRMQNFIYGL